jgi:hypothetical protein
MRGLLLLLIPALAISQTGTLTLSGTVTGASGAPAANTQVSIRSVAGGQTTQAQTDDAGRYTAPNLAPGEYEVSAGGKSVRVTLGPENGTANLTLGELAVGDLGFGADQTKGNAAEQARLDKRSRMLKTHQRLGLITTAPLVATLITSASAKGGHNGSASSSDSGRQLHAALGGVTAGLYLTTASFAIFAPKAPAGTQLRGPIRWHRRLAWIHGPGMILTPILGGLAYQQRQRGEKVHGIAQAHGPVAIITGAAYGAAILTVSIKF